MDTVTIKKRLEFHTQRLDNLYVAYNKLLSGGVKSYRLDDRELTRLDLGKLSDEITGSGWLRRTTWCGFYSQL